MPASYVPHPKQVEAHKSILLDNKKRATLFWGRQVGKTMWSVNMAWIAAAITQGQYFIVFKTYAQASQVVWKQYKYMIPTELIAHENNDDLRITLHHLEGDLTLPGIGKVSIKHDPSKPASTIRLLGSDQAESHRGNKAQGMIFDEYADQTPTNWDEVYKWFFTTTDGWAVFMGTPKGYNHWYTMLEYAKKHPEEWYYSQATWRDNPAAKREMILQERKEAEEKGTLNSFLQEMELEFRAVEGSVYPMFKRDVHVCKPSEVPEAGTDYVTIDFGWHIDHPTAVNFIRVDIEDRWWVYDEIHVSETPLEDVIAQIKAKMAGRRITAVIADSARPDLIDVLGRNGLPVVPSNKGGSAGSKAPGISLLGSRMKPRMQLEGRPQPLIKFASNCDQTILQFEQYKYAEAKKDRPVSEEPIKKNDDHPDGIRYLALWLKWGQQKNDKPPAPMSFNEYGL